MQVIVDVVCSGPKRPPVGSPVIVQVRDTSLADAPSTILAQSVGTVVAGSAGEHVARVSIPIATVPKGATVRVHVDVGRTGHVSVGDFVSVASHPVPGGEKALIEVPVRPV